MTMEDIKNQQKEWVDEIHNLVDGLKSDLRVCTSAEDSIDENMRQVRKSLETLQCAMGNLENAENRLEELKYMKEEIEEGQDMADEEVEEDLEQETISRRCVGKLR